jgi:hypothetical protein
MSRAIERFENLIAWQKARELTREVYQITQRGAFTRVFLLARKRPALRCDHRFT